MLKEKDKCVAEPSILIDREKYSSQSFVYQRRENVVETSLPILCDLT